MGASGEVLAENHGDMLCFGHNWCESKILPGSGDLVGCGCRCLSTQSWYREVFHHGHRASSTDNHSGEYQVQLIYFVRIVVVKNGTKCPL